MTAMVAYLVVCQYLLIEFLIFFFYGFNLFLNILDVGTFVKNVDMQVPFFEGYECGK